RAGNIDVPQMRGSTALVSLAGYDRDAQEDARELTFSASGRIDLAGPGETEAYRIIYEVTDAPSGTVTLGSGNSTLDATANMALAAGKGWREMVLTPGCLATLDGTLSIASGGDFTIRIDSIAREDLGDAAECSF
ncbi:MAG: putative glycoside hydrolase, partial [Pseudomonadota bacterium]